MISQCRADNLARIYFSSLSRRSKHWKKCRKLILLQYLHPNGLYAQEPNVKRQSTLFVSYMLTIPRRIIIVLTTIHRVLEHIKHMRHSLLQQMLLHQPEKAILIFPEEYISSDDSLLMTGLTKDALKDIITRLPRTSYDERARYS